MNIGDTVRIRTTHQTGTIKRLEGHEAVVETNDCYLGWHRISDLEPGIDLKPGIARLSVDPVMRLATVNGEVV